jgi:hypothetical protein
LSRDVGTLAAFETPSGSLDAPSHHKGHRFRTNDITMRFARACVRANREGTTGEQR